MTGLRSRRTERGAVTVELTLVVPALLLVLGLLVAGGRIWFARTVVTSAAYSAARAASLARTPGSAAADGQDAGRASMATAGLRCASTSVEVQTAAFAVPAGTPATVRASVRCTVPLADISLPGLPGSLALEGQGAAALDTYRSRG